MPEQASFRAVVGDLATVAGLLAARQRRPVWRNAWGEPGWWALARYRLAHWLWRQDLRGPALWWSGRTRRATGIDLHPAARVGRGCLLLGPGIVVGELAVVGDECVIDAGAMLLSGGITPATLALAEEAPPPGRGHPSIGQGVRVEAGVRVVGDVFVGDGALLQAGAVVTRDVPDRAVALGPGTWVVAPAGVRPHLEARALQALAARLAALEDQVQVLAFATRRQGGNPELRGNLAYGPIAEVEGLVEAAGLD